ncbi:MAG: GNAT family N-acetyltransferase [Bacteroidales bacterium]|nr:GNAT family N-acetyltransferase [Bacteroidales bacterium]
MYSKILENDILKLRAIQTDDIDLIHRWENETSNWFVSQHITPFSRELIQNYVGNSDMDIYSVKQLRLMIDLQLDPGNTIGMVDLFEFDPQNRRAGVGLLIDKDYRYKGYGKAVLEILKAYAFRLLNLHQLYCSIDENNTASLSLFQKMGFEIIGKKTDWLRTPDGWHNEFLLQCILE